MAAKAPLRSVTSAVVTATAWGNLVLGQRKIDDKSNEIKAIPKLLDALELSGTVVTIDAMGCQRNIAEKIVDRRADYILAVKENQPSLLADVKDSFQMQGEVVPVVRTVFPGF